MSVRIIEEFDHFYQDKSLAIYCTISILESCTQSQIFNLFFSYIITTYLH